MTYFYQPMKTKYILLLFLFSLFYSSCKKEKKEYLLPESFEAVKIYAGIDDPSLFNYTFINPMSVRITYDANNLYGRGTTELDLDLDGVTDLTVVLNLINQDSVHLLNGNLPIPAPSCSIQGNSSVAIAIRTEEIEVNGQITMQDWCDTVSRGREINSDLNWSSTNTSLMLWKEAVGFTLGTWSLIEGVSYIGFRFNGKFGWIEVDATNPYNPLFTKFSMQR